MQRGSRRYLKSISRVMSETSLTGIKKKGGPCQRIIKIDNLFFSLSIGIRSSWQTFTTTVTGTILGGGFNFSFCTRGQIPICTSLWYTHYFRGTLIQHNAAVSWLRIRRKMKVLTLGWMAETNEASARVRPCSVWLGTLRPSTGGPNTTLGGVQNYKNKSKVGTDF